MRLRNNVTFGTWNVRTLNRTGNLEELEYEMKKYTWQVLGLCEVRWKGSGNVVTDNGNHLYYSGEEKYHKNGVGFLIHKDIKDFVAEFKPISSRICTLRLKAKPLNISIIQIYAPTSDYTDEQIEIFYYSLQDIIDKTHKKEHVNNSR